MPRQFVGLATPAWISTHRLIVLLRCRPLAHCRDGVCHGTKQVNREHAHPTGQALVLEEQKGLSVVGHSAIVLLEKEAAARHGQAEKPPEVAWRNVDPLELVNLGRQTLVRDGAVWRYSRGNVELGNGMQRDMADNL